MSVKKSVSGSYVAASGELEDLILLNRVADKVWDLLKHTITIPDIAGAIMTEFDLTYDDALNQTRQLVDTFRQSNPDFINSIGLT